MYGMYSPLVSFDSSAYLFGEIPADRPFFPGADDSLVRSTEFLGVPGVSVPAVRSYVDPKMFIFSSCRFLTLADLVGSFSRLTQASFYFIVTS